MRHVLASKPRRKRTGAKRATRTTGKIQAKAKGGARLIDSAEPTATSEPKTKAKTSTPNPRTSHGPVRRIVGDTPLKPYKEAAQEHELDLELKALRDFREAKARRASRGR
jgi:hypothetical protein